MTKHKTFAQLFS